MSTSTIKASEGYLLLEEAAELLGRSPSTIQRKMREGKIRYLQPFGGGR